MTQTETPVQIPLTLARAAEESLQHQVFRQIRAAIVEGRLKGGTRLTSIRGLAEQLGLSVNTVKLAYQQLIAEGYLEATRARGTFVAHALPDEALDPIRPPPPAPSADRHAARFPPAFVSRGRVNRRPVLPRGTIDFWPGRTDPRSFPTRDWRTLVGHRLANVRANLTDYGDAAGLPALRLAIADHLGRARGFRPDPGRIVITSGIQEALCIAARMLVAPGATAAMEKPGYMGASYAFEGFGAEVERVGVDANGLIVEDLPQKPVSALYVTPSHQFPLGRTLSMARRTALLAWAGESGAYILEDDYDSDFRFESSPLPALASLDRRGAVIYLGTFSKAMGAGIRLGYMVVPEELAELAAEVKNLFSLSQAWLTQAVMADYITSGDYARRLRQLRHDRKARRDSLIQALKRHFGAVTLRGLSGGMHVVWHLPPRLPPAQALEAGAAERGVRVYSPQSAGADMTGCARLNTRLLVFGYASLTPEEIESGIATLAACARAAAE